MSIFARRTALLLLGTAAFLLNPVACATGDGDDDYQYGETELRRAIEGNWRLTVGHPTGGARVVNFRLAQATGTASASGGGLVRPAMACGSRTLVRSAGACTDVTTMPLTGQVTDGDQELRMVTVKGELTVLGLVFTQGNFTIEFGTARLTGVITSDGKVTSLSGDFLDSGTGVMQRIE